MLPVAGRADPPSAMNGGRHRHGDGAPKKPVERLLRADHRPAGAAIGDELLRLCDLARAGRAEGHIVVLSEREGPRFDHRDGDIRLVQQGLDEQMGRHPHCPSGDRSGTVLPENGVAARSSTASAEWTTCSALQSMIFGKCQPVNPTPARCGSSCALSYTPARDLANSRSSRKVRRLPSLITSGAGRCRGVGMSKPLRSGQRSNPIENKKRTSGSPSFYPTVDWNDLA